MNSTNIAEDHQELAKSALSHYPIAEYNIEFIRHNENLTYYVQDSKANLSYLLRIHTPKLEGFQGIQQTKLAIESELQWLMALKQDTDIPVQQALPNMDNELVTMLPASPKDIPCTMLTWIDAQPFTQESENAETLVYRLGALNAKLHIHTKKWKYPENFLRLTYDESLLQEALANMEIGVQQGIIESQDALIASEAGFYVLELFKSMGRNPDLWGLIHADLLSGNVLIYDEKLIPIDFSLSGFGHYFLDMGICLSNLKKPLRQCYLDGYGISISNEQRHHIEALIIMAILFSTTRHLNNEVWQEWFHRRFPVIAQKYCPLLLRKKAFLFDI